MRSNVVISRNGKDSLHQYWISKNYIDRNWDLILLFYERKAFDNFNTSEGVSKFYIEGGKWTSIYNFLLSSNALNTYDYYWFPDDDLEIDSISINKMFQIMNKHNLFVAQPSLTKDSFYTFLLLIQNEDFILRYSNFIEVMAPCITKKVLQGALEDFKECESGIGLDHLWGNYFNYELKKMAILDEISMKHTRPVGGPLYDYLRSKNIDHMDELRKLLKKYSQRPIRPYVYEGLSKRNQTVKNKFLLGYLHLKEYYSKRNEFNDPKHTLKKLLRLFKYYFIYFIKT